MIQTKDSSQIYTLFPQHQGRVYTAMQLIPSHVPYASIHNALVPSPSSIHSQTLIAGTPCNPEPFRINAKHVNAKEIK
jgi:hypothetical protein